MVSSSLQLLENRYSDELDEDAEEFIAYAVDGAGRMQSVSEPGTGSIVRFTLPQTDPDRHS